MFIFRLAAALAGTHGVLGLVLAVVGVNGVVSFLVAPDAGDWDSDRARGTADDIIKLVSRGSCDW